MQEDNSSMIQSSRVEQTLQTADLSAKRIDFALIA